MATPEDHARRALDAEAAGRVCLASVAGLASVIRVAVEEEREACARLADLEVRDAVNADIRFVAKALAEGIRARGQ